MRKSPYLGRKLDGIAAPATWSQYAANCRSYTERTAWPLSDMLEDLAKLCEQAAEAAAEALDD